MRARLPCPKNSACSKRAFLPVVVVMARKGGDPGWSSGRPAKLRPCLPTGFEEEVRRLGLDEQNYIGSAKLRQWCQDNKDRRYIPERLLEHWRIHVNPNVS